MICHISYKISSREKLLARKSILTSLIFSIKKILSIVFSFRCTESSTVGDGKLSLNWNEKLLFSYFSTGEQNYLIFRQKTRIHPWYIFSCFSLERTGEIYRKVNSGAHWRTKIYTQVAKTKLRKVLFSILCSQSVVTNVKEKRMENLESNVPIIQDRFCLCVPCLLKSSSVFRYYTMLKKLEENF